MIVLKGCKPDHVSREQVRSFLYAAVMVLAYHNRCPRLPLVARVKRTLKPTWAAGTWNGSEVHLKSDLCPEQMLMACVHETIHACIRFPEGTVEKCTSTLTSRIKEDVLRISEVLLEGTYRRAAYLAHTKLSYRTTTGDFYDESQHDKVGVQARYLKTKGDR